MPISVEDSPESLEKLKPPLTRPALRIAGLSRARYMKTLLVCLCALAWVCGTVGSGVANQDGPCGTVITIRGSGFGNAQTEVYGSGYGVTHIVDFAGSGGVYTALKIKKWTDTMIKVGFYNFYRDGPFDIYGNQILDERDYYQDEAQETIFACCTDSVMDLGLYAVTIKTVWFVDDGDTPWQFESQDTIYQVHSTDPGGMIFELTNDPILYSIRPKHEIYEGGVMGITGLNFGDVQGDSMVRCGRKSEATSAILGLGKPLKVKTWHNDYIKATALRVKQDKKKFIWVEKDEVKSVNYIKIMILDSPPPGP
jgi:hypothetical protein